MPAAWSKKDERQYRAIKASCLARDARRTRACPRIAAATVNKQRRKEGRTLSGLGLFATNPAKISNVDRELLRLSMIAELDAISLYEQLAKQTKNEKLKKILLDVAREEKTHVGEFQTLLCKIDPEYTQELRAGRKEVGLEQPPDVIPALPAWAEALIGLGLLGLIIAAVRGAKADE
jgi:hypothetical protein